jgi:hypothetical protein
LKQNETEWSTKKANINKYNDQLAKRRPKDAKLKLIALFQLNYPTNEQDRLYREILHESRSQSHI